MPADLSHLHLHSEFSLFDGCGKVGDFVKRAAEHGHESVAVTEHGSVRGLLKANEACQEHEIRLIPGVELYFCEDMHKKGMSAEEIADLTKDVPFKQRKEAIYQAERAAGLLGRYHLTVLAKNQVGLKNLIKVTSLGWVQGWYKRPRIDLDCLEEHREGLVVLSGCMSGPIGAGLLADGGPDMDDVAAKMGRLWETFGDDFLLEVMPHDMDPQRKLNEFCAKLHRRWDLPLVATQDAHYINPGDWKYQEATLCIQTKSDMRNPNRFRFDTHDFWMKGRADMEESFRRWHGQLTAQQIKASLDNTLLVAEKCQAKIELDRFKALVPSIEIPSEFGGDESSYLRHLCLQGWKDRDLDRNIRETASVRSLSYEVTQKLYRERLDTELSRIAELRVDRYFLVVWDLYNWVRLQKIEAGPGRGSVGGSLAAYLLRITDLDPIKFNLLFERFLSPSRVDMPDVDCDYEDLRREEVIGYLRRKYGEDYTAQVGTANKMTAKAVIKDVCRIFGIPIKDTQPVVDAMIHRVQGDDRFDKAIEDSFNEIPICQEFEAKYPQIVEYAKALEGQVKTVGLHAAGVVVSPVPLIDICPLELRDERSKQPKVATAFDMHGVADLGLMKLDILGISNLTVMRRCREMIHERHGIEIDWMTIPLDDEETLDGFTRGDFLGIFQYDTPSAEKLCEGVKFSSFADISALVALNRPGPKDSGLAAEYLKRLKDPKERKSIHPIVDAICHDTFGVIVYQEHVVRIFTDLAGFSPAKADEMRKKISKKHGGEAIAQARGDFVQGAVRNGMSQERADALMAAIGHFGRYAFNLAHSAAYALTGYRQMWLKVHYPLEFFWALLDSEDDDEKLARLVMAAFRRGVKIRTADVNAKDPSRWSLNDDVISGSVAKIKGVGQVATKAIAETRPFIDFVDFVERVNRRKCNKGTVSALLRGGAFNMIVPNPKWLAENLDQIWNLKKAGWQDVARQLLSASAALDQWTPEEAQERAAEVNPVAMGADPLDRYKSLTDGMRDDWVSFQDDLFWSHTDGFVWGRILDVRVNTVGDFHKGEPPTEAEKRKKGWGQKFASLTIEDTTGRKQRVKVDPDLLESHMSIVERGMGTVVAGHVVIQKQWKSVKANFLVNLGTLKSKLDFGSNALETEEFALYKGWSPGSHQPRMTDGKIKFDALVLRVNVKFDKKDKEMSFIGLLCSDGRYRELVCFASSWPAFSRRINRGMIARFSVRRDGRSLILDESADFLIRPDQ